MKTVLLFGGLVGLLVSCSKDNQPDPADQPLYGSYIGTFNRNGIDTASVILTLDGSHFTGTSSREKYPAICEGTYSLNASTIRFTNTCTWTADFDWTLILDGEYQYTKDGNGKVRIWRTDGTNTDEYLLERRTR